MTLLDAALHLAVNGCSVVPVRNDGSKAPAAFWRTHMTTPADHTQLHTWFNNGASYDGLGVICGAVSGHLEMLEVEGRAAGLVETLAQALVDHGYGDLWGRLCAGWLEQSPSGGLHWLYRVDGQARPNTKLARRPNPAGPGVDVLIETRGEGGFTVTAPSAGRSHPSGVAWTLLAGGPHTAPTITVDERDALYAIANLLDQMPTLDTPTADPFAAGSTTSTRSTDGRRRPGDDYNERTSWDDILTPHGWQLAKKFGGSCYGWTRPGKKARDGISATTGRNDGDNLYVFSSSTVFDTEKPYSKFGAYTVLEHGGDHAAAARDLARRGYGDPFPEPVLTLAPTPPPAPPPAVDGTTALHQAAPDNVVQLQPGLRTVGDSEDAHAHRLIASYGDLIRYCPARRRWLVWSGARWEWQPDGGGQVREYAKTVARNLTDREAALTQRRRALSAAGIAGCLRQAETDPRVVVDMDDLDADPYALNTPGGVVDLRTGHIHPPDPASMCTKTTTVAPTATGDQLWQQFLDDTFGDDRELAGYVQRLVGLTLVGQVREQLLAFLHGVGANGKSTLAETLMHALGTGETGYATAAPSEMLMIRKHSEHPAELAQLAGARMVVCSELDDGQRFAESRIKHLTGRDSINARFLYGQPFTFTPSHTIWLLGNHRPQASTGGDAFWRRVKLIEFRHVVPAERRDPALGDKLNAAGGTVLAWAIAGAVDYFTNGLREPGSVAQAVSSYAADQDTVGRFVADSCHRADTEEVRIRATVLRSAYETWCRENGDEPVSARRLTSELRERFGVGEARSHGQRFHTRITILEPAEPDRHEPPEEPVEPAQPGFDDDWGFR